MSERIIALSNFILENRNFILGIFLCLYFIILPLEFFYFIREEKIEFEFVMITIFLILWIIFAFVIN